ncbi:hypothetical protein ACFRCW_40700 [Streptomyces sp. NPDC056653]|uniref:hypothetical protein n=1 Tax=Streptomyces sp. NPDC056653 TaxID=3345894 RepID=UPI00369CB869
MSNAEDMRAISTSAFSRRWAIFTMPLTTLTATATTAPTITGSMPHSPFPGGLLGYRPRTRAPQQWYLEWEL